MKTPQQLEKVVSSLLDIVDTLISYEMRKDNYNDNILIECKEVMRSVKDSFYKS